jgi:DNA-binding NarL/FixJ family response regulator
MTRVGRVEVGVLVVDDQDPFRRAMSTVVEATEGFAVVGVVASGEESVLAAAA